MLAQSFYPRVKTLGQKHKELACVQGVHVFIYNT
jgi:hypothetical protein